MPYFNNELVQKGALMTDTRWGNPPQRTEFILALFDGSFYGIQDDTAGNTVPANSSNASRRGIDETS